MRSDRKVATMMFGLIVFFALASGLGWKLNAFAGAGYVCSAMTAIATTMLIIHRLNKPKAA